MLSTDTRKRIRTRKWKTHSNPPQFLARAKEQSDQAIRDLTLIAEKFPEKHLNDVFTVEKLRPLMKAILESKSMRTLIITEMIAGKVYEKLMSELSTDLANALSSDIGKSWMYAQILVKGEIKLKSTKE
jgi:hypothetical protein